MVKFHTVTKITAAIVFATIMLGACSTPRSIYKDENFSTKGPFEHHFDAAPDITYAAMKNVILRQGYTLEKQSDSEYAFVASKQRQKDKVNAVLTISAVASNDGDNGTNGWMAVQEADFVVNETKNTSSVSLLFLSVPIPTGSTKSVNKERGETVMDPKFYVNLFDAVDKEIPYSRKEIAAEQLESQKRMRTAAEDKLRAETQARSIVGKEAADKAKAETSNARKTNVPVHNSAGTQTPENQTNIGH
ncbi:MAG: DUF2242 domain-containing protein [Burkholderiales bacterium]